MEQKVTENIETWECFVNICHALYYECKIWRDRIVKYTEVGNVFQAHKT